MAREIEMGQAVFGNPTGDYGTPPFVDALVEGLLSEIDRVYWNVNHEQWNRHADPKIPGLEFRPYYWGDDETEADKPNLKFDFAEQEIRWYKHPGRGQSSSLEYTPAEWAEWYEQGLKIIGEADRDLY